MYRKASWKSQKLSPLQTKVAENVPSVSSSLKDQEYIASFNCFMYRLANALEKRHPWALPR